ncbi:MAG: DegV family protein [Clostridium sp.]|nr:DegV family protein [Acetatifactor muris]MCM1526197.1 DegV family protein [Bacteroides sp.]MCM1562655.1 DegV family protein [Clostridium sp.]
MSYKIVLDSCGEIPKEYEGDDRFESVPLGLEVGDYCVWDDKDFDQAEFLRKVAECPLCPRSSCPSPERYMDAYACEAERVYVITLSAQLSGSHNSACLAKNLYLEKYGGQQIHVVDSQSASCGETQIALKIMELEEQGLSFEQVVEQAENFRDRMETWFVLDNLETLRKNGRLSKVKAMVASTLSIKPIMAGDKGVIVQKGQSIGIKKALGRMAEMAAQTPDAPNRRLMITHCNAPERAEMVKNMVMEKAAFRECIIMDTRGVSSMYANDGGVIVTA